MKLAVTLSCLLSILTSCSHTKIGHYDYEDFLVVVEKEILETPMYSTGNQFFSALISCEVVKKPTEYQACVDKVFEVGVARINELYPLADLEHVEGKYASEKDEGIPTIGKKVKKWPKLSSHDPLKEEESLLAALASLYYYETLVTESYVKNKAAMTYAIHAQSITKITELNNSQRGMSKRKPASSNKIVRLESLETETPKSSPASSK